MKLKQPVNWKHTTFLWILRFMLSGVAVSIVFQCLRIIELYQVPEQSLRFIPWEVNNVVYWQKADSFPADFMLFLTPCLQLQMPAYMLFCFCGVYRQ